MDRHPRENETRRTTLSFWRDDDYKLAPPDCDMKPYDDFLEENPQTQECSTSTAQESPQRTSTRATTQLSRKKSERDLKKPANKRKKKKKEREKKKKREREMKKEKKEGEREKRRTNKTE